MSACHAASLPRPNNAISALEKTAETLLGVGMEAPVENNPAPPNRPRKRAD
jgi:hypothetical protein